MNLFDHVVEMSRKFDEQHDIYEAFGGMGKAYWITGKGKLFDVSSDMGGGTDDHVGFFAIAEQEVPVEEFGITREEAVAMHEAYLNGEFTDASINAQYKILRSGAIRIRVYPETFAALSDKRDSKTRNRLIDFMLEKKIKRDEILWEDSDQSMKEYTYTDFMGMNESLEGLDDVINIQVSEPSNATDEYMRGLSNGLLTAKAIVTDDPNEVKLIGPDGKIDEMSYRYLTRKMRNFIEDMAVKGKDVFTISDELQKEFKLDTFSAERIVSDYFNPKKKKRNESIDFSKWSNAQLDFAAKLGLGPKYVPTPRKTYECNHCHGHNAYYQTMHEDTDMEENELYCPDCKRVVESVNEEVIEHKYSNVQILAPHDVAQKVIEFGLSIPDEDIYTDPDDPSMGRELVPHITIKWGLVTEDPNEVESLIEDDAQPFQIVLGMVSIFEGDDKPYDVVKIDVHGGEALHQLHKRFSTLENGDENPEYVPHLTIAYVKKGAGKKYVEREDFVGVEFGVDCFEFKDQHGNSKQIVLNSNII